MRKARVKQIRRCQLCGSEISEDERCHCGARPSQNPSSDNETQEHLNLNLQFLNLTLSNSEESSSGVGDAGAAGLSDVTESSSSWERHRVSATQESGRFEARMPSGVLLDTDDVNSVVSATASEEERRQSRERRRIPRDVTVSGEEVRSAISRLSTEVILRYIDQPRSSSSASSVSEVRKCKLKPIPPCNAQVSAGCEGYCAEHYATLVRSSILKPSEKLVKKVRKSLKRKAEKQEVSVEPTQTSSNRAKSGGARPKEGGRRERSASARVTTDKRTRTRKAAAKRDMNLRTEDIIESSEEVNEAPCRSRRDPKRKEKRCIAPQCDAPLSSSDEQPLCRNCRKILEAERQRKKAEAKAMKREIRQARACAHCSQPPPPRPPQHASCSCHHTEVRPVPASRWRCHSSFRPSFERQHSCCRHPICADGADSSNDEEVFSGDVPSSLVTDFRSLDPFRPSDSGFESPRETCSTPGCSKDPFERGLCEACHRYKLRHR